MSRGNETPAHQDGQILVLFTLAIVVLLGFAGLALDGGSAFAQRRDQQTAADLAALAAANDYLINGNVSQAIDRGRTVATSNGYAHGTGATSVDVAIDTSNGVRVTVGVHADHRNTLVGVLGMPIWRVTTAASALAGFPNTVHGASPFIFSAAAFQTDGTPLYQTEMDFGETNGDVPTSSIDFAWTNYTGNVNTTEVSEIVQGTRTIDKTLQFGDYIGQHNNGNHNFLYSEVDSWLDGTDVPAAVVDANGNFVGWSMFHVTSASGGADKHVRGYFLSAFESALMTISSCAANDCPRYLGSYVLKLTD